MEKTFELSVGDRVWLMQKNRTTVGTVTNAWYTRFISPVDFSSIVESEWYTVCDADGKRIDTFRKESLFQTKEDLIKTL